MRSHRSTLCFIPGQSHPGGAFTEGENSSVFVENYWLFAKQMKSSAWPTTEEPFSCADDVWLRKLNSKKNRAMSAKCEHCQKTGIALLHCVNILVYHAERREHDGKIFHARCFNLWKKACEDRERERRNRENYDKVPDVSPAYYRVGVCEGS